MSYRLISTLIAMVFAAAMPGQAFAEVITLDAFLNQVREKHQGYRGSVEAGQGIEQRATESKTVLSPQLFANASHSVDKTQKAMPASMGIRTDFDSYSLGLSQMTSFGLQGKLYYTVNYTDIAGTNPAYLPMPKYYDLKPALEISQSLWRNGFGRETRATVEAGQEQALALAYVERFKAKMTLAESEMAYWRLAAAREALVISKASVERSEKIRDWAAQRAKYRLSDESELLQAEAALHLRKLELQGATDEERSASFAFNAARGVNSEKVDGELIKVGSIDTENVALPVRAKYREDVEAALHQEKATDASARIGVERNQPTLDLFAAGTLNGHDPKAPPAFSEASKGQYPAYTFGVKFSVPLDLGLISDNRAGYRREAEGGTLKYERKVFEQERDWTELLSRYGESRRRLGLAKQLEEVQRAKYAKERDRHSRGRTTTFMVLQFEQDYLQAQVIRLRNQGELLSLLAQMKTFSSEGGVQ